MKKRLLLLTAAAGITLQTQAQVTVTPEFGFLLTKPTGYTTDNGMRNTTNYDWSMGVRGGFSFDIPIGSKGISFEPGLFYNSKNRHQVENSDISAIDMRFSVNNAELPINLKYSWEVGQYKGKLFVHVSPYVSYSFSGRKSGDITIKKPMAITTSIDQPINFKSGTSQEMKPLDYGVYAAFGYQFQMGLQLKMFYGTGLANTSVIDGMGYRNGAMFGISAGFVLGRKLPGRFY
jgi:hypothetical protein